jgi:ATP-dependent protease ClpP protease subunit
MQGKIYIGGEITHEQIEDAQSFGRTNLITLNKQIDSQPDATGYDVTLNTVGGSVTEGLAMYQRLREVSASGKLITTKIKGNLASIGTVVFLAGDKRIVNELFEPFVHEAQGGVMGSNSDVQDYAKQMDHVNNKMVEHYKKHLNISKEEILEMMKGETYISPEMAIEIGFATDVEEILRPAAKLNIANKLNIKNERMSEKVEFSNEDKSVIAKFAKFLGFDGKTEKKEIKNILVKTANQEELDFIEREEGTPEAGDKVTYSGDDEAIKEAIKSGSIVMANGETYVIESGVLKEIQPKEEDAQAPPEEMQATIDDLKRQLEAKGGDIEAKETELQAKETEFVALQDTHTNLVNKIKGFSSTESVDTVDKNPKKEITAKKTFKERMENMANKTN